VHEKAARGASPGQFPISRKLLATFQLKLRTQAPSSIAALGTLQCYRARAHGLPHRPVHPTTNATHHAEIEFVVRVNPKKTVKYRVTSPTLKKATPWTCNPAYLCKAVLPVTIKTYTGSPTSASVPDGLAAVTLKASTSINDGKANRGFEARVTTAFVVNNLK
jgi:hypothetical protein